ncbi:MAG TPA: ribosome-associated translation inhibitor RaiA [Bacteroidota bacterium]|nr:ribosome-associated translation inhibitor RaiA [Bacteroidota bacterium]
MEIHFTARKFRAHADVRAHALDEVKKLDKYYDGIVRSDIILSYERSVASVKTAEINLHVYGTVLSAREQSDDFHKSIGLAVGKLERQLSKYKTKQRMKNKKTLRSVKEIRTDKGEEGE